MNAKRKGSRNEHRTMRMYEAQGYACTRAAASLGMFDLICLGIADNLLVQVKTNRWPPKAEMDVIAAFRTNPLNRKIVVRWDDYTREPKIKEVS